MTRKFVSGILIGISSILLVLSLVGIGAVWYYNQPLTSEITARMSNVDDELAAAQTALQNAGNELERALRIVQSAEEALEALSGQTAQAKEILDAVTDALDETIMPGLEKSRVKIDEAQKTMDDLRASIETLNRIPFVNLKMPDDGILNSFVEVMNSLEGEIERVEGIAREASTFLSDTSYLLGGDLQETMDNILELQVVITEYERKISTWRGHLATLQAEFPGWIDCATITLTIFLLWFGISQFGLLLHGLNAWHGENPLVVLQRKPKNKN